MKLLLQLNLQLILAFYSFRLDFDLDLVLQTNIHKKSTVVYLLFVIEYTAPIIPIENTEANKEPIIITAPKFFIDVISEVRSGANPAVVRRMEKNCAGASSFTDSIRDLVLRLQAK